MYQVAINRTSAEHWEGYYCNAKETRKLMLEKQRICGKFRTLLHHKRRQRSIRRGFNATHILCNRLLIQYLIK